MKHEPSEIPEHESPLRRMMSNAHGTPYHPLQSLDEAQQYEDGVAILEGDWGGQIYAVIPVSIIRCSTKRLERLLLDLDRLAWVCNENDGASIYFERKPAGTGVAGGMGGGASTGDLWVHKEFQDIEDQIRDVILGKRESFSTDDDS